MEDIKILFIIALILVFECMTINSILKELKARKKQNKNNKRHSNRKRG